MRYTVNYKRNFKNCDDYDRVYRSLLQIDIDNLFEVLHSLRLKNGFYSASSSDDYAYTWLRDNFFCSLPELDNNKALYRQTYHTWLDYYIQIEDRYKKFSSLIDKKTIDNEWEFPNPRIHFDLSEIHSGWNHVQIDQIGYFLLGIAKGAEAGIKMIRDDNDKKIISLCIEMLSAIQFYNVAESGAWEEGRETPRASTIGVVIAGLNAIKKSGIVEVDQQLIDASILALNSILPRETPSRSYDLAQLFLIYPCDMLDDKMKMKVVSNIEKYLMGENGVYRYKKDKYYSNGKEAEWVFGLCFLGIIYCKLGDKSRAKSLYETIMSNISDYEVPELYYNGTLTPNDNTPLAWSIAMTIQLANELLQ